MITKNEEESIMEEAIGSKISDYLIKLCKSKSDFTFYKKNIDTSRLIEEKLLEIIKQNFEKLQ